MKITLSAVLLAGGESRRMGRDKATVHYKDEPLWQQQIELLRRIAPLEILISARIDPVWRPPDAVFVADTPPSRGPLSGLAAAMSVMEGTHLLALAVDMPLMTDTYLQMMWKLAEPGKGVLPVIDSRFEPLAAIYPRECFPAINSALQTISDFSVSGVAQQLVNAGYLRAVDVHKKHQLFFRNLNSPADVTYLSKKHSEYACD
jgi:molybdopterin-guanine dinucleotide biosynthesis protein A